MKEEYDILLKEAEMKLFLMERGYKRDGLTFYREFKVKEKHWLIINKERIVNFIGVIFYRDGLSMKSLGEHNVILKSFSIKYEENQITTEEFEELIIQLENVHL